MDNVNNVDKKDNNIRYIKIYTPNDRTTNKAFFYNGMINDQPNILFYKNPNCEILTNLYKLPKFWTNLYSYLPDDFEICINLVTLFSMKQLMEFSELYSNQDQCDFIDLGLKSRGMGHCNVLSWNKNLEKAFWREDGGSNDYDRMHNYNYYIRDYKKENGFKPENYPYFDNMEDAF